MLDPIFLPLIKLQQLEGFNPLKLGEFWQIYAHFFLLCLYSLDISHKFLFY